MSRRRTESSKFAMCKRLEVVGDGLRELVFERRRLRFSTGERDRDRDAERLILRVSGERGI